MKINSGDKLHNGTTVPVQQQQKPRGDTSFSDVLGQVAKTSEIGAKATFHPVQPAHRPEMIFTSRSVAQSTERMLDAMENYQRSLADKGKSLKSIASEVEKLKTEVGLLEPMVSQMADDDQMKQIATDALILASKEIARFDGGAYVGE